MLVSVITLNYNKSHLTIDCLQSLYEQFKDEFVNDQLELIIVDNASADNSVRELNTYINRRRYKNIKVIANSENSGFGKGCNIGAKESSGEFILFLNNDTVVKDRGIIKMAKYMQENPKVAILGGQLKNTDGTLQASTGKFYTLPYALMLALGMQRFGMLDKSPKGIKKVDWVKGGLMMIKSEVFKRLKGFDENIFMYTEDMELCYRAKKLGFDTYFYPDILVFHMEYGSTNRTFAIVNIYKNLLYFYKKHKSRIEYIILKFIFSTKAYFLLILGTITGNSYLKQTYKQALEAIR